MYTKILFLFFFLLSLSVKAQQPVSVHLTEKDGLPDIEFYRVLEDNKGFIWLAADKGLYRYDGKTYTHYTNLEKRGFSVFEPFQDHLGRVWCTNISGQFFYTDQDQLITFIDLKEELKGQLADFVVTKNELIITSIYSLYIVNLETKKVDYIIDKSSMLSNVSKYNDKFLLIEKDSILLFNENFTQKEKQLLVFEDFNIKSDNFFYVGFVNIKGLTLFNKRVNDKNHIFKIQRSDFNKAKVVEGLNEIENVRINHFKEINETLYFFTNKGVFIYDLIDGVFKLKKHFFSNENVTDAIIDKDLNYWITTLNNGIYIIPNIEMIQYDLPVDIQNIVAIDKANDSSLLFGTVNGYVGRFNLITNQIEKTVFFDNKVSSLLSNGTQKYSYVATDNNAFILDKKSFEYSEAGFVYGAKSLSHISNDSILYSKYNGVGYYSKSLDKLFSIKSGKRAYTTFYSKKSKTAYVGYVDNLVLLDSEFKPTTIKHKGSEILAISITQTSNGNIWVGTFKSGVYKLQGNKVLKHYDTSSGLLSNEIEYLQADNDKLWVATSKGLQLLDVESQKFKSLTKTDGILSYKISGIQIFEDTVAIASNKGIFSFNKQHVFKPLTASNIYIESVEVNEQYVDFSEALILDYQQNAIKLSFNINGLIFNRKGRYKYRLLGYKTNWVTTEIGETSVKYNSLPSGKYTFQVQPDFDVSFNNNQVLDLEFSIKRPFWRTWWFILGATILVLGTTILYFSRKIKKKEILRQQEIKQLSLDNELIALKLENLRSQMNPHFIFNALNSIQEYIVLNQKKLASEYLGKFADLIRTYLNHSTKGKITLQEEIDCLEMYLELEKLRFEDKLHYTITASGSLNPDEVNIPTMLIQPYVENALKHGLLHRKTDRNLKINFFINEQVNTIRCIILDNGVGRDQAEKFKARSHKNHKSFATKATQDRLSLLNYGKQKQIGVTITDLFNEEVATGTQVDITIPFTTQ